MKLNHITLSVGKAILTVFASAITLYKDIYVSAYSIVLSHIDFNVNLTEKIHLCWKIMHT